MSNGADTAIIEESLDPSAAIYATALFVLRLIAAQMVMSRMNLRGSSSQCRVSMRFQDLRERSAWREKQSQTQRYDGRDVERTQAFGDMAQARDHRSNIYLSETNQKFLAKALLPLTQICNLDEEHSPQAAGPKSS